MNQMDLFGAETSEMDASSEEETLAISSGRVGPIRFGSTAASYPLVKDVLTDLARQSEESGNGSS